MTAYGALRSRLAASQELRGFVISFAPTVLALGLQLAIFVLLGRALGPAQFGEISAALAVTAVLVEVVGLGSGDILVRAVSRRPELCQVYYGSALRLGALTLPPTALLGFWLARSFLHSTIAGAPLLTLMVVEIGAARVAATAESVSVAHRDVVRASAVRLGWAAARFVAAVVVLGILKVHSVSTWIWWTTGQSLATAAIFLIVLSRSYGGPTGLIVTGEIGTGALFAINQTSRAAQGNLDRAFLASVTGGAVLGAYAAGSRIVQLGLFPIQILNRILYPRFFALGQAGGLAATRRYALKCSPLVFGAGLAGMISVSASALIIPTLLGRAYGSAKFVTLGLGCALPFIALQYPAADALTGSGRQGLRTVIFVGSAFIFSVGLAVGARAAGIRGVATAYVVGHTVLAVLLWALLLVSRDAPPALDPHGARA